MITWDGIPQLTDGLIHVDLYTEWGMDGRTANYHFCWKQFQRLEYLERMILELGKLEYRDYKELQKLKLWSKSARKRKYIRTDIGKYYSYGEVAEDVHIKTIKYVIAQWEWHFGSKIYKSAMNGTERWTPDYIVLARGTQLV